MCDPKKKDLNKCVSSLVSGLLGVNNGQACKPKFRFRDLTSCLCSAAAPAVCFKAHVAGVEATETGNEFSQLRF